MKTIAEKCPSALARLKSSMCQRKNYCTVRNVSCRTTSNCRVADKQVRYIINSISLFSKALYKLYNHYLLDDGYGSPRANPLSSYGAGSAAGPRGGRRLFPRHSGQGHNLFL